MTGRLNCERGCSVPDRRSLCARRRNECDYKEDDGSGGKAWGSSEFVAIWKSTGVKYEAVNVVQLRGKYMGLGSDRVACNYTAKSKRGA